MSRRKPYSGERLFGQLILECPHGHSLGAIVLTAMGSVYVLDRRVSDNKRSDAQQLTPGEKVKAMCQACREAGRYPDYQASWATVAEELKRQRDDTRSEQSVFRFS